jgi:DNA transposition AAA+ family ATPase
MSDQPPLYNSVAPLANVARLVQLIKRCQSREYGLPGMGCCHGRAGLGKTTAAIYATNSLNACHVEALPIGGVKGLLTMIAAELGLKPARTTDAVFAQVAQQLARSQRPLIIDEADHILQDRPIEIVRRLHDMTAVPVILMGEEMLPQRLMKWERVHSRVLDWAGMDSATAQDVDHLARIYARGVDLGADLKAALLVASRGSMRNVSTNLSHVREFASVKGLTAIRLSDWGTKPFHTGEAPAPRLPPQGTIRKGYAA